MNKKKFQRVLGLFKDGVPVRVCIESILAMSTSNVQATTWIEKLNEEMIDGLLKDNHKLRREVASFEEGLRTGLYSIGETDDKPVDTGK